MGINPMIITVSARPSLRPLTKEGSTEDINLLLCLVPVIQACYTVETIQETSGEGRSTWSTSLSKSCLPEVPQNHLPNLFHKAAWVLPFLLAVRDNEEVKQVSSFLQL